MKKEKKSGKRMQWALKRLAAEGPACGMGIPAIVLKHSMLMAAVVLIFSACADADKPKTSEKSGITVEKEPDMTDENNIADEPASDDNIDDGRQYTVVELPSARWWYNNGNFVQHLEYERNEYGNYVNIAQYDENGNFISYTTTAKTTEDENGVTVDDGSQRWEYQLGTDGKMEMISVSESKTNNILFSIQYSDTGEAKYITQTHDSSNRKTYKIEYFDENFNRIKALNYDNGALKTTSIMVYSEKGNLLSQSVYNGSSTDDEALRSQYTYEDSDYDEHGHCRAYYVEGFMQELKKEYYTDEQFNILYHDSNSKYEYEYAEYKVLDDELLLAYFALH